MTANLQTFSVFFTVDPQSTREADRLVLMRRFLTSGFGPEINILDEAVLVDYPGQAFFVLAEAAGPESFDSIVSLCKGVYILSINVAKAEDAGKLNMGSSYCIIASQLNGAAPLPAPSPHDSVILHYSVSISSGKPFSRLFIVDAPSAQLAIDYGRYNAPGCYVQAASTMSMKTYFDEKTNPQPLEKPAGDPVQDSNTVHTVTVTPYSIINEGIQPVMYVSSDFTQPFVEEVMVKGVNILHELPIVVSSCTYFWSYFGGIFPCQASWWYDNGIGPDTTGVQYQEIDTNQQHASRWSYPDLVIPNLSATSSGKTFTLEFNLAKEKGYRARTPLYLWMNALLYTKQYDAGWPEDSYTGGMAAAYAYILTQLPGQVPPNKGTNKEKQTVSGINFPNNGNFTKEEFTAVQNHLLLEMDYFKTVDKWFAPGSIIYSINTLIAQSATNDLASATALMSIPNPQSPVTLMLDVLLGAIAGAMNVIPEIGGVISTVVSMSWMAAKSQMGDKASQPIQVAVADMANELNQNLQDMADAAQTQLNILYSDWGKLQQFSYGVITGIISEDQFFPPGSGLQSGDSYKPQGFVEAGANAWLKIIYQQLFTVAHTPDCNLSFSNNIPANPWNPDAGQYAFTWSIPCVYSDSKGDKQNGYAVFSCNTNAPDQVKKVLFGSSSQLNVSPVDFYLGLSGWPRQIPTYNAGRQDEIPSQGVGLVPIIDIGFTVGQ